MSEATDKPYFSKKITNNINKNKPSNHKMANTEIDLHRMFRYAIPGYLFLFVLIISCLLNSCLPNNVNYKEIIAPLIAIFLIAGFIVGFVFFCIFHLIYISFFREKFFKYVTKSTSKNKNQKCWEIRLKNDLRLFQGKDISEQERKRIWFLTSKFYMCFTIIVSQFFALIIIITIIIPRLDMSVFSYLFIPLLLIPYCFSEGMHNFYLLRGFNREVINKNK